MNQPGFETRSPGLKAATLTIELQHSIDKQNQLLLGGLINGQINSPDLMYENDELKLPRKRKYFMG